MAARVETVPTSTIDGLAIRRDFPIYQQPPADGRLPLVFLDSAASSQRPAVVIDAVSDFYRHSNANIHRGVYQLSERATMLYEEARQITAEFINAAQARECIFVRNTTEAINLVASSWGRANLNPGDRILLSVLEHHSNLVPWQLIAEERGAIIDYIPLASEQRLDMEVFETLLKSEPKMVAVTHVSNAVGTINDVATIVQKAHEAGALILIDGAQSVPHMPIDVQALDVDFLVFSGHKLLAPMGSGILYGKRKLLDAMPPYMSGGSMIRKVTLEKTTFADLPAKFEAGTPAVADQVGLGAAIHYLTGLGMDQVRQHEIELLGYALEQLPSVPGFRSFGPEDLNERAGVISFTLGDIHPHDVASILDGENVAVRAGHHCAQPLMHELGVTATTRASFYVYNTKDDVDRLIAGLHKANKIFGLS